MEVIRDDNEVREARARRDLAKVDGRSQGFIENEPGVAAKANAALLEAAPKAWLEIEAEIGMTLPW